MVQFQRRIRAVKHVALRHSDLQVKVFDATSNDPNTPSAEQLEELTHLAYQCEIADELVTLLLKRMQTTDPKRYWYRVYKSLLIVEYLLLYGPDKVVRGFWSRFQELQEFERFRYNDDSGFDHTVHIRELARRITKVLIDPAILSDNRKRTSKVTFETAQSSTAFTSLSLSMSSSDSLRHSPSDSYSRFKRDSAILGSSLELPRTPESPHGEADLDVMVIGHEHSTEESEWLATMDILGIPRTAEETPSESKEEWLSELSPSSPISISSLLFLDGVKTRPQLKRTLHPQRAPR
ncbi:hypothetical protein K474DRAFT_324952 [Panus rudis PR-1116 ss-1]|nr:hypothetical protein K474DRAFT_324952 [Panus rudis PR-1116 ss-1]